jgi:hypothetical protein
VLRPLSKLDDSDTYPSYVVVINALDECEGDKYVQTIIQLLAEARSLKKVQLRVLITSRLEVSIRYGFCQIPDAEHYNFVLHDIEAAIVDHDISIFLDHELRSIGQERTLEAGWPGEQALRRLVLNASGLFLGCDGMSFYPRRKTIRREETIHDARRQHICFSTRTPT